MSRIGKKPIDVPKGIQVKISGNNISISGPKGELKRDISSKIGIEIKDDKIILSPSDSNFAKNAIWGLYRALINNMIKGVSEGFEKKLEIQGVGYKAAVAGNKLTLNVGFSHPVEYIAPSGITLAVEKNVIKISGADKELVGSVAANIRDIKKPEPYKGKGIRYSGEVVRQKAGKKAVATSG